eukprot:6206810-Pleurochrysis_carterae.AAC.1
MRLTVLRHVHQALQALAPYHHAPAINCRASPLLLQLAGSTTTVVRKVSVVWVKGILLEQQTRQATTKAHHYSVRTEAKRPLDHGAAMR